MHLTSAVRSATCYVTERAASSSGAFRGLGLLLAGPYRPSGELFFGLRPWVSWEHYVCLTPPDVAASTVTSPVRFSFSVLLLPLDMVLDFCRLDRSDGNGFAP